MLRGATALLGAWVAQRTVRHLALTADRSHGSTPKGASTHGPLDSPGSTSARAPLGATAVKVPIAASVARSSVRATTGGRSRRAHSAALREEALSWAEALSAAGERICDLGLEDEGIACYEVAGDLLAVAGEFDR